jgi:hypothetical protein
LAFKAINGDLIHPDRQHNAESTVNINIMQRANAVVVCPPYNNSICGGNIPISFRKVNDTSFYQLTDYNIV